MSSNFDTCVASTSVSVLAWGTWNQVISWHNKVNCVSFLCLIYNLRNCLGTLNGYAMYLEEVERAPFLSSYTLFKINRRKNLVDWLQLGCISTYAQVTYWMLLLFICSCNADHLIVGLYTYFQICEFYMLHRLSGILMRRYMFLCSNIT